MKSAYQKPEMDVIATPYDVITESQPDHLPGVKL